MKRAVVLLSGGLDSATAAAMAKREGWELFALTLKYGQVHQAELRASRRVAESLGVSKHVELEVDLKAFGGSSLTGEGAIPKDDLDHAGIPSTYVPARNTVFLSLALWSGGREREAMQALGHVTVESADLRGYGRAARMYFDQLD